MATDRELAAAHFGVPVENLSQEQLDFWRTDQQKQSAPPADPPAPPPAEREPEAPPPAPAPAPIESPQAHLRQILAEAEEAVARYRTAAADTYDRVAAEAAAQAKRIRGG